MIEAIVNPLLEATNTARQNRFQIKIGYQSKSHFNIDALGFRKTRNENPPTWEIGVTS